MNPTFNFTEIGLETRDRRVYEALLEQPQASLRQIAASTGINRGSVYESVKQLVSAGLVGSIQTGKQQRYVAQDPEIIIELLKERQRQAQAAELTAEQYIKDLAKQTHENTEQNTPSFAVYFEGDEDMAAILRDVLATMNKSRQKHYHVISSKRIRHYIYANFPNFTRQRIKEGIEVSVIAIGEGGDADALSNRRWLSADNAEHYNCYTIIYANKTAFISINEQNVLSGIVIENQGVTDVQKEQFVRLWDTLAPNK